MKHRVVFAQLGSRRQYTDAVALHRLGLLRELHTDVYNRRGEAVERLADRLSFAGRALSRLTHCYHPALGDARVVTHPLVALRRIVDERIRSAQDEADFLDRSGRIGAAFARAVRRSMAADFTVYFGFPAASLEILERCRDSGRIGILYQFDPGPEHWRVANEERRRWPGWEPELRRMPEYWFGRIRAEWAAARLVVVSSDWTRQSLLAQGVPEAKIVVSPLSYEAPRLAPKAPAAAFDAQRPLRVLWIGAVNVTKGFPYLVRAAELLEQAPVEFTIIGESRISGEVMSRLPPNMRYLGALPRRFAHAYYDASDLFVFPTLSDGFGLTQLEAASRGLPLIVTDHCGRVVDDGVEGFVVPPRDAEAIADGIRRLLADPRLHARMAEAARTKASGFSVEALCHRYKRLFQDKLG